MKLILFAIALCIVASCGGEENVKNGETQDKKRLADVNKQLAELNAKLERENEELMEEIITQRVELEQLRQIKIQIQVQANATGDTRKLCQSEIKKYLQEHNSSDDQGKNTDSGIQTYHSSGETKLLKTVNGQAGGNAMGVNKVRKLFNSDGTCTGHDKRKWQYTVPFPHFVWYKFTESHIPARLSFTRVKLYMNEGCTPKSWEFVGTTDENCDQSSNWISLCGDLSGSNYVENAVISCDVPKQARKPYKCLAIRILSNKSNQMHVGSSYDTTVLTTCTCFKELKFWEVL